MSLEAREGLVNSGRLFFQDATQGPDLLDPNLTHTELIAMLIFLTSTCGHHIEVTAVRTDHHDDSGLSADGVGTHACGWAVDCWPLSSATAGDYEDASTQAFQVFLRDIAEGPFLRQVGLAGTAATPANFTAAGPTAFDDGGADHIHIGTNP